MPPPIWIVGAFIIIIYFHAPRPPQWTVWSLKKIRTLFACRGRRRGPPYTHWLAKVHGEKRPSYDGIFAQEKKSGVTGDLAAGAAFSIYFWFPGGYDLKKKDPLEHSVIILLRSLQHIREYLSFGAFRHALPMFCTCALAATCSVSHIYLGG